MQKTSAITRRNLLKGATAVALGAPYILSASALGAAGRPAAGERIVMGAIGVGGRGTDNMRTFLGSPEVQMVAVCDVFEDRRQRAKGTVDKRYGSADCTAYNDFRDLVTRPDIDAVCIGTPDHWHVLHALEAVRAGKDVYCEKPLGLSIEQGKALRAAVRRYGRVFQFGTQERSSGSTRLAAEIVLNGWIGKVHTIKVGTRFSRSSPNYPSMPVPDGLDYDLWLGPAPWAPYTANRVSNSHWFHISDYALGFLAGCGIHTIDMAAWGNGTDRTGPVEVEGTGEFPRDGLCDCALAWNVDLRFANGVTMNFTDGNQNPLGVRFEGSDGWVFVKERHLGGTVDAEPKSLLRRTAGPDEVRLPVSNNHHQNFLECIKSRRDPVAPIEVAVRSDTLCQLSDIAMRLRRKLKWDPVQEEFVGDAEAARRMDRPMREPWRI
ncbi:MAG: Gfo/Idh/MocA family oxidoreductase [Planctomycetota bacterium]|nr:Gfo/Idh/MocA family oxidoreductase [Planctomycetota bacterium]